VDRRNFEFSYCCAGNITGLLLTYASDKLMRLEAHVPAISKNFSATLTSETFALNPRDRLIFCTSGVVNATNKDGEKFGEERLYKSILRAPRTGAHELRNEILYQVERFHGDLNLKRDLTAVVVEVKDRVIKLARDPR
jgi:phosphoserine phosphatase RsbU/P